MTTDKARKRAIRGRMAKTGESYTAARRHIAPPAAPSGTDPAAPAGPTPAPLSSLPPRVAEPGVSEEAIVHGTGRGWDDWLRVLDARGTSGFSHRATAAWLRGEIGVQAWWAQTITVGFERARGLRAAHQVGASFDVGVSRTFPVAIDRAWAAITDEAGRSRWLASGLLRERTVQPGRSARFDVAGGHSRVAVYLDAKGQAKTAVTVRHERLASATEVEERRAFWRARLAALGALLAAEGSADSAAAPPMGGTESTGSAAKVVFPLDEYLAGVDPARAKLVIELDQLVRAAAPELCVAIKYRMLTYALERDWGHWVAALSVTKQAVNLRLLYGTRLAGGAGILRAGSSHLANLDLAPGGPVDAALVTRLVREAVVRHPEFLAGGQGAGRAGSR